MAPCRRPASDPWQDLPLMPAADRLRLAVIAADLARTAEATDARPRAAARDAAGHAARLARALAGHPRPATSFADLEAAPQWLRGPASARDTLALKAALMLTAPHLARSIDGARLKAVAEAAGAEALDAAIAAGADRDPAAAPDIAAADLPATGCAILAATLSPGLAALLPPAPSMDPAVARAALADAMATP